nr:hypothetical protein Iba_chr14dCG0050 [Ipomoea batatas]
MKDGGVETHSWHIEHASLARLWLTLFAVQLAWEITTLLNASLKTIASTSFRVKTPLPRTLEAATPKKVVHT